MDNAFLVAGLACLIGAVIGGGLKAFGVEIPVLASLRRQVALGLLGVVFLVVGANPSFHREQRGGSGYSQAKEIPQATDTQPSQPITSGPISLDANSNPRTVAPGGSTEIAVLATADGVPLQGAQIIVAAGGGAFENGATKAIGKTDEKGLFHTTWRTYEASAYTGDMSYQIDVEAKKPGYVDGKTSVQVFVHK